MLICIKGNKGKGLDFMSRNDTETMDFFFFAI